MTTIDLQVGDMVFDPRGLGQFGIIVDQDGYQSRVSVGDVYVVCPTLWLTPIRPVATDQLPDVVKLQHEVTELRSRIAVLEQRVAPMYSRHIGLRR